MPRVIPFLAVMAVAALLLAGCASPARERGHTSDSSVETSPIEKLELPASLLFDAAFDFSAVTSHAFTIGQLPELGWSGETNDEGMLYLTREGCGVLLAVVPYTVSEGSIEIDNSATFLSSYMGTSDWDEILPAMWTVNAGASELEALTVSGIGRTGSYEISTARVLNGIGRVYLASLRCDEGIATEKVFVDVIVPNISIEMR